MYPVSEWSIVNFEKAKNPQKKYRVNIRNKQTGATKWIEFGASAYEHYKDTTPLKLYSNLDHYDKHRRKLFQTRFQHLYTPDKFDPTYFSWKYLW